MKEHIIRLRNEIEEYEKEVLKKMSLDNLEANATELLFCASILNIIINYFSNEEGLKNITIKRLLEEYYERDPQDINILDNDDMIDFISNLLLYEE